MSDVEVAVPRFYQPELPPEPDYVALADKLSAILSRYVHDPAGMKYRGNDLYEHALRELLSSASSGFITTRQATNTLNAHTVVDKGNLARAEERYGDLYQRYVALGRDSARLAANTLRHWCNERTVPSRLRREGVTLAADLLDPPKARSEEQAS